MKKILRVATFLIPILALLSSTCLAADSVSLSISCTIPAIPGVNSPGIIHEEQLPPKINLSENKAPEEITQKNPAVISQDDTTYQKTIYSR